MTGAWRRHPITGKQFRVRASTAAELEHRLRRIDDWRFEVQQRQRELAPADLTAIDDEIHGWTHGRLTLAELAAHYQRRKDIAPATARRIGSFLDAAAGALAHRRFSELDGPAIARWVEALTGRSLQPSTVTGYWRVLRALGRFALERGFVRRVPWDAYRPRVRTGGALGPRLRESARTVDELERLLVAARELDAHSDRAVPAAFEAKIVATALLGLRQSELARLTWHDLHERTREVSFRESKRPHGVRSRVTLETLPELFEALERHRQTLIRKRLFRPTGPVFPAPKSVSGSPRAYRGGEILARRDLRAVVKQAHLPNPEAWSAHSLRDTFVTLEAHARAGDLRTIAARSRHVSISALFRYLQSLARARPAPGFSLGGAAATLTHGGSTHAARALPEHKK
jgi:integrase